MKIITCLRGGYTLIEASIALLLLAVFLVGASESALSMVRYDDLDNRVTELEMDTLRALALINRDLSNTSINQFYFGGFYNSNSPSQVLPYQITPTSTSYPYGHQFYFLKLRGERNVDVNPQNLAVVPPDFTQIKSFEQYQTAPSITSLLVDPHSSAGQMTFSPAWEAATTLSFADNQIITNLRHYLYSVVPSSITGTGQLKRFYLNNATHYTLPADLTTAIDPLAGGWAEDATIADNVKDVRFDTSLNTVGPNQLPRNTIRVTLTLERRAQIPGSADLTKTMQTSISVNF